MDNLDAKIARLERKLAREVSAREQAEQLLESKSRDLYEALQLAERANDKLAALANQDILTGLLNRRGLADEHEKLAALNERHGAPIGLVLFDLNGFKQINDQHGHEVGDQFLVRQSQQLSRHCRDSDVVARLGGDEFVVLTSTVSSRNDLNQLGCKLQSQLSQPALINGQVLRGGGSFGAVLTDPGTSLKDLLRIADEAMYAQKRQLSPAWPRKA